jgi:MOB kinase activator 1
VAFPRTFKDTVRTIVRRLFRVYAHIYTNHFDQICALGIEGGFQSLLVAHLLSINVY